MKRVTTGELKDMKRTATLLATSALAISTTASAADMANEMTIVSWGGAYSASQLHAYHEPYAEKTGIKIINDESSPEAVAKLRAMKEANNLTWDLVDVEAADAIRLCDEGLAMEIDADTQLADAPDGTKASADFGDTPRSTSGWHGVRTAWDIRSASFHDKLPIFRPCRGTCIRRLSWIFQKPLTLLRAPICANSTTPERCPSI